jgi:hypothetical protein
MWSETQIPTVKSEAATYVLRHLRSDERPWYERYSTPLVLIIFVLIMWTSVYAHVQYWVDAIKNGSPRALAQLVQFVLIGAFVLYAAYKAPRLRATAARRQLIITDQDITLKSRSADASPEQVIWNIKREEIESIRVFAAARNSRFTIIKKGVTGNRVRQWLAGQIGGYLLSAPRWVRIERKDVKSHPPMPNYTGFSTRKQMRKDMMASDLGQALQACGYVQD